MRLSVWMRRSGDTCCQNRGSNVRQKAPPISTRQPNTARKSYFHRAGWEAHQSTSTPRATRARGAPTLATSSQSKPGTK